MDSSICEEIQLKTLQVQFLTKLARWANFGKGDVSVSFDLPDIVVLLQSCGYRIRRVDALNPEDLTPLRDNEEGNMVLISCMHSGQRCFLEKVQTKQECSCVGNIEPNKDGFWEITATTGGNSGKNESVIETGSDYIPKVTKEQKILIKTVMSFLITTLKESGEATNSSRSSSMNSLSGIGDNSSPDRNYRRLSGFLKDIGANPRITISPSVTKANLPTYGKGPDSPARYRSLDTLTSSVDTELPGPGKLTPKTSKNSKKLRSPINITKSSPSINSTEEPNSSSSTIGDSHNEKVIQLLKKAIFILEQNKSENISPSNFMNPLKLIKGMVEHTKKKTAPTKSSSTPNLPKETSKISNNLVSKQEGKKPVTSITKTLQTTKSASCIKKPNNLYSHVKSTIPKAASASKLGELKKK